MQPENKYCIKISSLFTPENIEIFTDKIELDDLIYKLLENLALNYGIGNINSIFTQSYKNSIKSETQNKIASECLLYHFRIAPEENTRIAIAVLKKGVIQPSVNTNEKVSIVVLITSPKAKPDIYLKIAKSLKELFSKIDLDSILKIEIKEEIWKIIDQANISLPEIILAGDIMEEVKVYLKESNNLKDAIDKFVQTGFLSIPVVDLEGNLVGEVTSHELMEVCLPRYILWMDDISPIINFEPFQNLLENEDNTWLAEIMNQNCPVIQINEPFIKSAIMMTKKNSNHVYVLDDNKLIGIINLRFFLDKIVRE